MNIIEQLPGYIGWKDTNFRHLGCNEQLASMIQLKKTSHIVGLLDEECLGCTDETANFHRKNDILALSGKIVTVIHQSAAPYDGSLFYSVKKPLLTDGYIVGLIYQCHEYRKNSFFTQMRLQCDQNALRQLPSSHYQIESHTNPYQLSMRELETLFCMLHGMTAKQVAELMTLSKRTIETYVDNIKNKFGCSNKSEMLVQGLNAGYMNHIPQRFLQMKDELF